MRHNLKLPDIPFLAMQTGGGPVGVTPISFANLEGWWKADSFSLPDATAVGGTGKEWVDQVGNINHYGRNATGSLQPIFHTNISGTKPAILFTWKNDFSDQHYLDATNGSSANTINPASDYTVLAVVKPSSLSATTDGAIVGNAYTGNCALIVLTSSQSLLCYDGINPSAQSILLPPLLDTVLMAGYIRSGGTVSFRFNKQNVTNGAPSTINAGHFSFLGAVAAPPAVSRWSGYMMEVCIWSQALSESDCDALYTTYFKPRWVDLP